MDSKPQSILKNPNGFTLFEVMIAIVILSFVMLGSYQIIDIFLDTRETIIEEDRERLAVEYALYRIGADFSQAYTPLYHDGLKPLDSSIYKEDQNAPQDSYLKDESFQPSPNYQMLTARGLPVPSFESAGKDEYIMFTSSNRRKVQDSKQSRYAWVRYRMRGTEVEDEFISERLRTDNEIVRQISNENIYSPETNWDNVRAQVLLRNVKDFKFEFWNEETQKFVDNPRQLNELKDTPRLIRVVLNWVNRDNVEEEFIRTYRVYWPTYDTNRDAEKLKKEHRANRSKDSVGDPQ